MKIQSKAAHKAGEDLKNFSYEENENLAPYQIYIDVLSCGICYSDIHMIDNDWNSSTFPLVPGHEIVGIVKDKGELVSHLTVGDRVGIGWQRSSCHQCRDCLAGFENLCKVRPERQDTIVGNHGGFGHNLVFDSRFAFKIPENLDTPNSAPLFCGGITVYGGLKYAGLNTGSGKRVGVIGIGGLGHMAVQFASKLGNEVTIFTTSPDKAEFAHKLGAKHAIITNEEVPKPEKQLDIMINTVDVPLDWSQYVRFLNTDGTLTFVGNPGDINIPVGLLLSKRRRIMANPIGGRKDIVEMLDIASRHGISAIIEEFPLDDVNSALQKVRDGDVRYRAVLKMK